MAQEIQKYLKLGQEIGLVGNDLKVLMKERQEKVKTERLRIEAD